ncbi:MAG TPA: ACP S-malonyltransferase, partial [Mycobacteriales bacterium]|nr:ACP S-malonyltransferase [Mycobacteriales bacterium]
RFDLCLQRLRDLGATALVEAAPGGTLTGIAARELPGTPAVPLRTPDDLDAARALMAAVPVPA